MAGPSAPAAISRGLREWEAAIADSAVELDGERGLVRQMPAWFRGTRVATRMGPGAKGPPRRARGSHSRSGLRRVSRVEPQRLIVRVSPLVVSSRVTLSHSRDIGGVQSGWNVAVTVRLKSAFPF